MLRILSGVLALLASLSACIAPPAPEVNPPAQAAPTVLPERLGGAIRFAYDHDTLELTKTAVTLVIRDAETYAALHARLPRFVLDANDWFIPNPDPLLQIAQADFQHNILVVVTRPDSLSAPPRIEQVTEQPDSVQVIFSYPQVLAEPIQPVGLGSYTLLRLPASDKPILFRRLGE